LIEIVVLAVVSAKAMLEFQVDSGEGFLFFGALDVERNEVGFGVYFRTLVGSRAVRHPDGAIRLSGRVRCWSCLIWGTRPVGESHWWELATALWIISNHMSGISTIVAYFFSVSFGITSHDAVGAVSVMWCGVVWCGAVW
jgi:hypothetical protein